MWEIAQLKAPYNRRQKVMFDSHNLCDGTSGAEKEGEEEKK